MGHGGDGARQVISRTTTVVAGSGSEATTTTTTTTVPTTRSLKFCLLACETKSPYGPVNHTAELLLDLLSMAALKHDSSVIWNILIHLYDVQAQEYPSSLDVFDGYLIPGSFSSAYDEDPWIATLQQFIQTEIVAKQLPTLAICFGHQVFAHSFVDGQAIPVPSGARIGRLTATCTASGMALLNKETMDLYCTHVDMVATLPANAVPLAGDAKVPIQAAAYFSSADDARLFQETSSTGANDNHVVDDDDRPKPFAITFQAHPEYATSKNRGVEQTLERCMDSMEKVGSVDSVMRSRASQDAKETFPSVHNDSIDAIAQAGRWLGWFDVAVNH